MMAEFKELIKYLCTEEMMNEGTGPIVYYNGKPGYLGAYDAGLGFAWFSRDDDEHQYELSENELTLTP